VEAEVVHHLTSGFDFGDAVPKYFHGAVQYLKSASVVVPIKKTQQS
jgi:hypothetical protein